MVECQVLFLTGQRSLVRLPGSALGRALQLALEKLTEPRAGDVVGKDGEIFAVAAIGYPLVIKHSYGKSP